MENPTSPTETVLDENENYKLVLLKTEHSDEASQVLATSFADREPLGAKQWKPQDALPFMKYSTDELGIKEQISFVIVDKTTSQIAHVLINFDYTTPLNFDWTSMPRSKRQGAVGSTIRSLSANFEKEFPQVQPGEVLHLWMAATKEGYEGKGLLLWSSKTLVKYAKERGWKKIVVEATAPGTHHVLVNKLGFTVNNTVYPAKLYPELADLGEDFTCTYLVGEL